MIQSHPAIAPRAVLVDGLQPPCPECAVALLPTGRGRYLYWSCGYCGITMRRS